MKQPAALSRRRAGQLLLTASAVGAVSVPMLLAGCVSVGVGSDTAEQRMFVLHDAGSASKLAQPLVAALLLQPLPAGAVAETLALAYSRRPNELSFYQMATWHERPVRQVPRLLAQRLEARGVAGAVGQIGDPLNGDWLLTVRVDQLQHDVAVEPGTARVSLTVELFDRRNNTRMARQQFDAQAPVASADSAAAAQALSVALSSTFDALVPWLEAEMAQAVAKSL